MIGEALILAGAAVFVFGGYVMFISRDPLGHSPPSAAILALLGAAVLLIGVVIKGVS